jgi:benzoyl-CoA reductase/2-hydroxyglutaryl-CoA dehydratase subunit BcrC/BadD/HgdB
VKDCIPHFIPNFATENIQWNLSAANAAITEEQLQKFLDNTTRRVQKRLEEDTIYIWFGITSSIYNNQEVLTLLHSLISLYYFS